jgi:hypothetical protein
VPGELQIPWFFSRFFKIFISSLDGQQREADNSETDVTKVLIPRPISDGKVVRNSKPQELQAYAEFAMDRHQEEPTDRGEGRQLFMDDTSRVSREAQARFREGLWVQFPGATRPFIEIGARGRSVNTWRLLFTKTRAVFSLGP